MTPELAEGNMAIRRKLPIKKVKFDAGKRSRSEAATAFVVADLDALQEHMSVRRKLGGAEARSDKDDERINDATRRARDTGRPSAPPVEIAEDD
jgi:hypothetical protein